MFEVQCPHCKKLLSLRQRKGLVLHSSIPCVYCNRLVRVRLNAVYLNSWFLGTFTGIAMTLILKSSLPFVICTALFVAFFLQGFIDIFYSLESDENDFYF
jgi:thioredoxin-related protein